jgi:hypothetical protein
MRLALFCSLWRVSTAYTTLDFFQAQFYICEGVSKCQSAVMLLPRLSLCATDDDCQKVSEPCYPPHANQLNSALVIFRRPVQPAA